VAQDGNSRYCLQPCAMISPMFCMVMVVGYRAQATEGGRAAGSSFQGGALYRLSPMGSGTQIGPNTRSYLCSTVSFVSVYICIILQLLFIVGFGAIFELFLGWLVFSLAMVSLLLWFFVAISVSPRFPSL
jgi:hypothetical protein